MLNGTLSLLVNVPILIVILLSDGIMSFITIREIFRGDWWSIILLIGLVMILGMTYKFFSACRSLWCKPGTV